MKYKNREITVEEANAIISRNPLELANFTEQTRELCMGAVDRYAMMRDSADGIPDRDEIFPDGLPDISAAQFMDLPVEAFTPAYIQDLVESDCMAAGHIPQEAITGEILADLLEDPLACDFVRVDDPKVWRKALNIMYFRHGRPAA